MEFLIVAFIGYAGYTLWEIKKALARQEQYLSFLCKQHTPPE